MKFLVLVCGWNCEPYVKGCLESIKNQTFKDFTVMVVNDASTDQTKEEIQKHIQEGWGWANNNENKGGYYNFDFWTRNIEGYEICVPFALDDIMKPNALELINEQYEQGKWMTYGTYINKDSFVYIDLDYSDSIHNSRDYRRDKFRCTGLRTYYQSLYLKTVPVEMDEIERTQYYDLEYAFQLMEMCGKDRIGVIKTPIYEYNNRNPNGTAQLNKFEREKYNEICKRQKKELILSL